MLARSPLRSISPLRPPCTREALRRPLSSMATPAADPTVADRMLAFINHCWTPFHAVGACARAPYPLRRAR